MFVCLFVLESYVLFYYKAVGLSVCLVIFAAWSILPCLEERCDVILFKLFV